MARELELFDGTVLDFPDETPDDVMLSAGQRETKRIKSATPRPLPEGIEPSEAGAGRSSGIGGMSIAEAQRQYGDVRQELAAGSKAWKRGTQVVSDEQRAEIEKQRGFVLDKPYQGSRPKVSDQELRVLQDSVGQKPYRPFAEAKPFTTAQNITQDVREATKNPVARGLVSGFSTLGQTGVGAVRAGAEMVGADSLARFAQDTSRTASTIGEGAVSDLKGNDQLIASVTSSIVNSLPAVGLGMMGGPALRTLFAQSAAADYAETGNAAHAGIMGAAEALGERFGFPEQIKLLKGITKGMPNNEVARVFGAMLAKEIPGEQATTAVQFLADKFGPGARNPNATFEDYLNQAGETLKVTIGQTAVMGGGPAAITVGRGEIKRADDAIQASSLNMAERAAKDSWQVGMPPTPEAEIARTINDRASRWSNYFAGQDPLTAESPQPIVRTPTQTRADSIRRFDELAAAAGLNPKAAAKVKEQAAAMPASEVPNFMSRVTGELNEAGLFYRPVDDAVIAELDATLNAQPGVADVADTVGNAPVRPADDGRSPGSGQVREQPSGVVPAAATAADGEGSTSPGAAGRGSQTNVDALSVGTAQPLAQPLATQDDAPDGLADQPAAEPVAPEVTWYGKGGKGMARQALPEHKRNLAKQYPNLEFTAAPAPEFGDNVFKLEGRPKVAPKPEAKPATQVAQQGLGQPATDIDALRRAWSKAAKEGRTEDAKAINEQILVAKGLKKAETPSRGPAASQAWVDEGKTPQQILSEKTDRIAGELAAQVATEVSEKDFAPSEMPAVVRQWAKDSEIPADEFRQSLLKAMDKLDISDARKAQIRKALDPTRTQEPAPNAQADETATELAKQAAKGEITDQQVVTALREKAKASGTDEQTLRQEVRKAFDNYERGDTRANKVKKALDATETTVLQQRVKALMALYKCVRA